LRDFLVQLKESGDGIIHEPPTKVKEEDDIAMNTPGMPLTEDIEEDI